MKKALITIMVTVIFASLATATYAQEASSNDLRVTIDAKDSPVQDVITKIFEGKGLSYVIDSQVGGTIGRLKLDNVKMSTAMDALAAAAGLKWTREAGIYYISQDQTVRKALEGSLSTVIANPNDKEEAAEGEETEEVAEEEEITEEQPRELTPGEQFILEMARRYYDQQMSYGYQGQSRMGYVGYPPVAQFGNSVSVIKGPFILGNKSNGNRYYSPYAGTGNLRNPVTPVQGNQPYGYFPYGPGYYYGQ